MLVAKRVEITSSLFPKFRSDAMVAFNFCHLVDEPLSELVGALLVVPLILYEEFDSSKCLTLPFAHDVVLVVQSDL